MEIHRVGVSVPLSETPTESVTPKEPPSAQPISQPFQHDAIVSHPNPGLDLGDAQTTPLQPSLGKSLQQDESWKGGLAEQEGDQQQRLLENILKTKRDTAQGILGKIR